MEKQWRQKGYSFLDFDLLSIPSPEPKRWFDVSFESNAFPELMDDIKPEFLPQLAPMFGLTGEALPGIEKIAADWENLPLDLKLVIMKIAAKVAVPRIQTSVDYVNNYINNYIVGTLE